MENVKYKICYWYHEYQDMSASVPTCDYYRQADEFPWGIGKVIAWYKPKPYKESEVEE